MRFSANAAVGMLGGSSVSHPWLAMSPFVSPKLPMLGTYTHGISKRPCIIRFNFPDLLPLLAYPDHVQAV